MPPRGDRGTLNRFSRQLNGGRVRDVHFSAPPWLRWRPPSVFLEVQAEGARGSGAIEIRPEAVSR